jgi:hypothetical protein
MGKACVPINGLIVAMGAVYRPLPSYGSGRFLSMAVQK